MMFGKKKSEENRFIIAVKDYSNTENLIKEGTISLPYSKDTYLKLLESQSSKADTLKELKKFIKESGKEKKEVIHFWEGLVVDGYTLINVEYLVSKPSLNQLCNNNTIKFVCTA